MSNQPAIILASSYLCNKLIVYIEVNFVYSFLAHSNVYFCDKIIEHLEHQLYYINKIPLCATHLAPNHRQTKTKQMKTTKTSNYKELYFSQEWVDITELKVE